MKTEEQLKAALVRELPEILELITPDFGEMYFQWAVSQVFVTKYEWPRIVQLVEEKLKDEQKGNYTMKLFGYLTTWWDLNELEIFRLATASWQVRAQSLADIGVITIKEESL